MHSTSLTHIVGIDEAGRGPLAGPVAVGAVVIPTGFSASFFAGIRDSKCLPQHKREMWHERLCAAQKEGLLRVSFSRTAPQRIDRVGLSRAVRMALFRTMGRLSLDPATTLVMLDGGLYAPPQFVHQRTIIRGDRREPLIAAASIVAKVRRDEMMRRLSARYPDYGFDQHKGYGTRQHYDSLRAYGPCLIHRKSFLHRLTVAAKRSRISMG